jgi:hypothetical protein
LGAAFFLFAAADSIRLSADAWRGVQPERPRASSSWIDAGLEAEQSGDYAGAEHSLLEAARMDRQHLPAWTLANFYFRRGDAARFWPWAQRAAALTYDDLTLLLRLCDELEPRPIAVLEHIGDTPRIHRAYLDFLIGRNRLADAQEIARRMEREPGSEARLADFAARLRAAASSH